MKFCMQCGHELGASRTCPSCGTTAPVEPLPAPQLPPAGVRYPLFADEVDSVSVTTSGHVLTAPVQEPVAAPPAATTHVRLPSIPVVPPRRHASAAVWAVLGLLVAGAFILGAWLLLHDRSSSSSHPPAKGSPSAGDATGTVDVASTARASAPVTRAPGRDTAGNTTSYDASNMVDGSPSTAWEMPGDGTGTELTFRLAKQTRLSQVGVINGYAKSAQQAGKKVDWYAGNRRVLRVEWLFDNGSTVSQDLTETTDMQTKAVDVTTRTVRLRLLEVTRPGTGPSARDMTPISEVKLVGTPG